MTTPQDDFMAHRRRQEAQTISHTIDEDNPLRSIMTVELNTTELCNRTCVFCPRINPEVYPNRNLHLSAGCVAKVARDLAAFAFRGRVSFSGFGEPVLNKTFPELIRTMRAWLPDAQIDTNTNGDKLTPDVVASLYAAGLTYIYVNMYDGPDQRPHFEQLFADAGIEAGRYRLRPHWGGAHQDFGLFLNNRSGMVIDPRLGLPAIVEPIAHPCYYPFVHAMVDWNGDMLLCSNDWGRALVVGNVIEQNFADVWMSPIMLDARRKLMVGDRSRKPCATCSVNGTLSGQYGFDLLVRYYKMHGSIEKDLVPMAPRDGAVSPSAAHTPRSPQCQESERI
jgi:radical SAM protein with 4Fe4S-binding SPASM domain